MTRRASWNPWLLSFALVALGGPASAAASDDESGIRQVQASQADAWNRHDATAYAIAHVSWTMTGAKTPPGIPEPKQGIQSQVLQKKSGHWLIQAFQNTNGAPETPFPLGPPAGAKP